MSMRSLNDTVGNRTFDFLHSTNDSVCIRAMPHMMRTLLLRNQCIMLSSVCWGTLL
jgi:hypothetical protein